MVWVPILLCTNVSFAQVRSLLHFKWSGMLIGSYHRWLQQTDSILDWWEGVSPTLPLLSGIARRVLAVPATSCDVERCFSALKWVRDERQQDMKEDTHRAAVLLHFNGIVN